MTSKVAIPVVLEGWTPPFSPAVRWGDLLFVSGQTSLDVGTMTVVGDDVGEQARLALEALMEVLRAAGSGPEHVLRVECYLAAPDGFRAWNAAFVEHFPTSPPARTTLVTGFPVPGMLIEIQATAGIPDAAPSG